MGYSLKTTKKAQEMLNDIKISTNLTPNIISRYAIALSLKDASPIDKFNYEANGQEFSRHILTGKYDTVFKALIMQHTGRELTDDEYYPTYIKCHLERGIRKLHREKQYAKSGRRFLENLIHYKDGGEF